MKHSARYYYRRSLGWILIMVAFALMAWAISTSAEASPASCDTIGRYGWNYCNAADFVDELQAHMVAWLQPYHSDPCIKLIITGINNIHVPFEYVSGPTYCLGASNPSPEWQPGFEQFGRDVWLVLLPAVLAHADPEQPEDIWDVCMRFVWSADVPVDVWGWRVPFWTTRVGGVVLAGCWSGLD